MSEPFDRRARRAALVPAAVVTLLGLVIVLLRPPLPVDETRYLEVFRESLRGSALLLRLSGEPYAEKPPLLFWLGQVLAALGCSTWFALRCLPALASGLTVWFTARIGRRVGLEHAGWLQAALLISTLSSQVLLFDPLLGACVWGALDAWTRRRDVPAWAWSSGALLAKGPVAFLFLIPLMWSTAPLRSGPPEPRLGRRAAVILGLALVPLAAWALSAAWLGGPEFADALLWKRWAGRVVNTADHPRPIYFFLPVAIIGALPTTLFFLHRARRPRPDWNRRMLVSLVIVLIAFSLISGKQMHYLVPGAPAWALVCAWTLETGDAGKELARLRYGVRALCGILVAGLLACTLLLHRAVDSVGELGRAWLEAGGFVPVFGAAIVALVVVGVAAGRARTVRGLCALTLCGFSACALAAHFAAGRLLFPHVLDHEIRAAPRAPVAILGSRQHGLYELLADRPEVDKLPGRDALVGWSAEHPDGLIVAEPADLGAVPAGLRELARDMVHRSKIVILDARSRE